MSVIIVFVKSMLLWVACRVAMNFYFRAKDAMRFLFLLCFALFFVLETPVAAEVLRPDHVSEWIELSPVSPIPQYCTPKNADANIFVLSKEDILLVFASDEIEDYKGFGFFDIKGFFLSDSDDSGKPEAYAFGTARSDLGGRYPSYLWLDNNGEQIDFREGTYSENFAQGLLLDESYKGDGMPTLVINLSEWMCWVAAYPSGDIASN